MNWHRISLKGMKSSLPLCLLAKTLCIPRGCPDYFLCCYKTWLRHAILPRYKKRRRLARSLVHSIVGSFSAFFFFSVSLAERRHFVMIRWGRREGMRPSKPSEGKEGTQRRLGKIIFVCCSCKSPSSFLAYQARPQSICLFRVKQPPYSFWINVNLT